MSGFLDNCHPSCECLELGEKRNAVVSVISGIMVGLLRFFCYSIGDVDWIWLKNKTIVINNL